jgi:hypothetical protein
MRGSFYMGSGRRRCNCVASSASPAASKIHCTTPTSLPPRLACCSPSFLYSRPPHQPQTHPQVTPRACLLFGGPGARFWTRTLQEKGGSTQANDAAWTSDCEGAHKR